ncbi:DUF3885 domain-containing protein [Brevibacillus sp. SIMBA_040]|uniref:DUF3885 domain-containing protein n=1 Tax=unclassified Brevibacillus TaxID=2684853 RepID=UPI003979E511
MRSVFLFEEIFDAADELSGISSQSCVWCKRDEIDYKVILTAFGYQDFPNFNQPFTREDVYFINPRSHIIYHLYDDRGLDVVSNHVFSISGLYRKYNSWILDYDRQRIDNMFKSV